MRVQLLKKKCFFHFHPEWASESPCEQSRGGGAGGPSSSRAAKAATPACWEAAGICAAFQRARCTAGNSAAARAMHPRGAAPPGRAARLETGACVSENALLNPYGVLNPSEYGVTLEPLVFPEAPSPRISHGGHSLVRYGMRRGNDRGGGLHQRARR